MSQLLAYHAAVHALEGLDGCTPTSRFASAVAHVNNGHLLYEHHKAGLRCAREGATERQIERADFAWGPLALFDAMVWFAERNARAGQPAPRQTLSGLARELGLDGSVATAAAQMFESEGAMSVDELARLLRCHRRTLERKLKSEGVTAEALRSAVRIVRACDRLSSVESLTTIAIGEGYADLSHMTRSFQSSVGMTPSSLRKILRLAKPPDGPRKLDAKHKSKIYIQEKT